MSLEYANKPKNDFTNLFEALNNFQQLQDKEDLQASQDACA